MAQKRKETDRRALSLTENLLRHSPDFTSLTLLLLSLREIFSYNTLYTTVLDFLFGYSIVSALRNGLRLEPPPPPAR